MNLFTNTDNREVKLILFFIIACCFQLKAAAIPNVVQGSAINIAIDSVFSGVVIDNNGRPLPGVTVKIKDTQIAVTTDVKVSFRITSRTDNVVLVFSTIGYVSQEKEARNNTAFTVTLEESISELEDVVVVGFGTQKKINLTGAVATLDSKAIESRPVSSVGQALQGVLPGLNISAPSLGGIDSAPSINIRGTGNLNTGSNASPLILIDGIAGDINALNPQDIENISVLKDAAAASIYGSRAPFGVILVTTKSGSKGKAKVQYSDNFRWSSPTHINDMLDSYRFAQYFNQGRRVVDVI